MPAIQMTIAYPSPAPDARLADIDRALRRRDMGRAAQLISDLTRSSPAYVDGWIAAARLAQMTADHSRMRVHLAKALTLAPGSPLIRLLDVEAQIHLGDVLSAIAALKEMEADAEGDAAWLGRISEAYSQCGDFDAAERCASAAMDLDSESASLQYALSSALIATGKLEQAEVLLDGLIASNPRDYDAYYNRATLRRQTPDNNHVDAIRKAIDETAQDPMSAVGLNYALAHELEDLGRHEESFVALKKGADARRAMMAYRVEKDIATMARIAEVFDTEFFAQARNGCDDQGPIFVLGLPRSGTTLVDRILGAHPEVESLGELNDFPLSLTALCRTIPGPGDLVSKAAGLNMRDLGEAYLHRIRQRGKGGRLFIDKAPANFLYIGLVAAALPTAKIIHLSRNPIDNAFGMYKALFRMGYPFSYNFDDLAKYMRAKSRLMTHWHAMLPGRIIEVHYEDIVADQEAQTRRLLSEVGLAWNPACLDFHKNTSPTATASAAQVRRPIYTSSVNRWRRYETQLAPLINALGDNQ
jgi:tetratricopeptide (TPR) repeat protein